MIPRLQQLEESVARQESYLEGAKRALWLHICCMACGHPNTHHFAGKCGWLTPVLPQMTAMSLKESADSLQVVELKTDKCPCPSRWTCG